MTATLETSDGRDQPEQTAHIHSSILSVGDIVGVQFEHGAPIQHRIVTVTESLEEPDDAPETVPSIAIGEFGYMQVGNEAAPGHVGGIMHASNVVAVDRDADFDTDLDTYEPTWDIVETDEKKAEAMLRSTVDEAIDRYGRGAVREALSKITD